MFARNSRASMIYSCMDRIDPERIDLARLAHHLAVEFDGSVEGYVVGRTRLRDAVAAHEQCSVLQAEELVDTLILRGLVEFSGDPGSAGAPGAWIIHDRRGA